MTDIVRRGRAVPRRAFLTAMVLGPTLVLVTGPRAAAAPVDEPDTGDVSIIAGLPTTPILVILEIRPDGTVRFELPRAEVGQGLTTSVAMIVAEELDISVGKVSATLAPARLELAAGQFTGNSNSIRSLWDPVRVIAATARARLIHAAAARWAVDSVTLTVVDGVVTAPDGRSVHFGEIASAAADPNLVVAPAAPKEEDAFSVIGTPTSRADARAIVTGRLEYAMDLDIAGAMPVMVRRPPTINGTVRDVDEAAIRAMPGVIDVAVVPSGVAIMARTFGQALAAKDAARVTWNPGTIDGQSSGSIRDTLRSSTPSFTGLGGMGVPVFLPDRRIGRDFDFAPVSHAPMETNTAVADVRDGSAEIWASTQSPVVAAESIALVLGLAPDRVTLHVVNAGGSFGRRLFFDGPLEAALISKAMGKPVRLMWSRIDDMRHGRARPATYSKFDVVLSGNDVTYWEQRVSAVATDFSHGLGDLVTAVTTPSPISSQTLFQTVRSPYSFAENGIESLVEVPLMMPTGSWRSVFAGTTRTAAEIMVDTIAAELGRDPLEYRIASVEDDGHRAVLQRLGDEGRWGTDLGPGRAQGIGFHSEYKSSAGYLVEIDARDPRAPRVTKAVIVVDVGLAVNPRTLEAQMLGCLTDGISTVLRAGLHFDDGLPLEASYSQFHFARQRDSPTDVRVIVMPPSGPPGGAGELGVPAAAAAVANAYARATGTSPSSFPILFDVDFEPFPR